MAICKKCGAQMDENEKFCPSCGSEATAAACECCCEECSGEACAEPNKKDKLAKTGKTLSIIGFILSFIPFVGACTSWLSLIGLVFGIIGKKAALPENQKKATSAIVFGIIGLVIATIALSIVYIIIGASAGLLESIESL